MNGQWLDQLPGFVPRSDLIELIPRGARRILDVGCGLGKTGVLLREKGFEEIFGIEINANAADEAKSFYKELFVGDVEKCTFPFEKGFFDCILYSDVLEHLVDPWEVLKSHKEILRDNGTIICSIPNFRYYRILRLLVLNGRWEYVELGILDRTHVRFFTLKTIEEMFRETGYEIKQVIKKRRCGRTMKLINRMVFNALVDFLVIQYRIIGAKSLRFTGKAHH